MFLMLLHIVANFPTTQAPRGVSPATRMSTTPTGSGVRRDPAMRWIVGGKAASRTLLEFGRNPHWLGGELGITMVLHTWGQNLGQHIHVHCIVTDGGLSPDGQRWLTPVRKGFLFPTAALSKVFRWQVSRLPRRRAP